MLEEYFLLVRRIPGIALSVEDYWNMDTWTTAKLLSMEREIIKEEMKSDPNNKDKYEERSEKNSDLANSIVDEMTIE